MKKPQTPAFSPAFYAGFGLLLAVVGSCRAGSAADSAKAADVNSLDVVLKKLALSTSELKSYQCRIEYLFSQPLFESQTLRTGRLYYQKSGRESKLRINFQTLKQDDGDQQKHIEQYIFDGVWLTHIDYQIKQVKRYQQADPNHPADAFELVSESFPIIGFDRIEDLKKQFEIKLAEQQGGRLESFIRLELEVKPDSIYKDWPSIDFWIDKELYLPARIVAVSTEEDIYQIRFLDAEANKKIDKKVFELKIPEGFEEEIIPLKKK